MLLLVASLAGCSAPCVPAWPKLALSVQELTFIASTAEERSEQIVRLSNDGGWPMGVRSIAIGDPAVPDFDVSWDPATMDCVARPEGIDVDTGGPEDTAPEPPSDPDDTVFVLPPGCGIPLVVGYTARTAGEVANALVVATSGASDDPAALDDSAVVTGARPWLADPDHDFGVTWLRSTSSSDTGSPPRESVYFVGDVLVPERTVVHEGETIAIDARVFAEDRGSLSYMWSVPGDAPEIAEEVLPTGARLTFTAPEVALGAELTAVYALVGDGAGGQDWAFAVVEVLDTDAVEADGCPE